MKVLRYLFIISLLFQIAYLRSPEIFAKNLIEGNGYPFEEYKDVITEDNYILTVYRIPHGRSIRNETKQESVVLMHGLMGTSVDFLRLGPEKGLGYVLADQNYDVWLPNARGSLYSLAHVKYNAKVHPDYWKFSWHEIGMYDLPAIFNLVTNVTKRESVTYIGMSEGTTDFYVLMSERPNFNQKVKLSISLAPIAYMKHTYNPLLRFLSLFEPVWTDLSNLLEIQRLPPKVLRESINFVTTNVCKPQIFEPFCKAIIKSTIFITGGFNPQEVDERPISSFIVAPYLDGSTRQVLHYAQNINSGEFRHYNYGPKMNMKLYGQKVPFKYNLTKISTPIFLFYGENDWLSDKRDVQRLCNEIQNCKLLYRVPQNDFSHFDFIFGKDAVKLVYDKVVDILKRNK